MGGLEQGARDVYRPVLEKALGWRYLTASVGVAIMIAMLGMVLSGRPNLEFFPSIEADFLSASVTMPQGTPAAGDRRGGRQAGSWRGAASYPSRRKAAQASEAGPVVKAAIRFTALTAVRSGDARGATCGEVDH